MAFFDSAGKRLGYVSVNRDITDRRHAEETIRALLNDVITAQEEERRRIARELHDETAQTLTSLLVGLRGGRGVAGARRRPATRPARCARTVSAALEGVKRIARGLRPSMLDDLGLEEALERLAAERRAHRPFIIDLHVTGPRLPRLPEARGDRALPRGAGGADERGQARRAQGGERPHSPEPPNVVRLVIEDDGSGFDVSRALSEQQLGLMGMRERAHLIGGSMTVESSPGCGTTICVSVPDLAPRRRPRRCSP